VRRNEEKAAEYLVARLHEGFEEMFERPFRRGDPQCSIQVFLDVWK